MDATLSRMLMDALDQERVVALATVVAGSGLGRQLLLDASAAPIGGDLGDAGLNAQAQVHASALFPTFGCAKTQAATREGPASLFVEVIGPRPRLVVVGAVHVAVPLVHMAKLLGYRTVVIDPRPVFASHARFGHADVLLVEWPDEALAKVRLHARTAIAVLSHDMKIDVPALVAALRQDLPYIGALGSKKTQAKRRAALIEAGVNEADIAKVRSPIGLDLGSRRAEDVALAIMAEIVAVTNGAPVGRSPSHGGDPVARQ